jgi:hypothetical protein
MDKNLKLHFRDALRNARSSALLDSEAFAGIILVLELIGNVSGKKKDGLQDVKAILKGFVEKSPLEEAAYRAHEYHVPFSRLFDLIVDGRNAAVHEGALARHLTGHAMELALLVEDALVSKYDTISDFMVRGATTALPWHPLSFVRQSMLLNSFSYLPVFMKVRDDESWWLISDFAVAAYLRACKTGADRTKRLSERLDEVINAGFIEPIKPTICESNSRISAILNAEDGEPKLVVGKHGELLGILTPFDLL